MKISFFQSILIITVYLAPALLQAQEYTDQLEELTVEKIMRDPKWIGTAPSGVFWSEDAKTIYFEWNPENNHGDSLYAISASGGSPAKVSPEDRRSLPAKNGTYSRNFRQKLYAKNGDLFIYDVRKGEEKVLLRTTKPASSAEFSQDEKQVIYMQDNNLFMKDLENGKTEQITDFQSGDAPKDRGARSSLDSWLEADQLAYFEVLKERKEKKELEEAQQKKDNPDKIMPIYTGSKMVNNVQLSPDERYVTYSLFERPTDGKNTIVPSYVTESGYTEDLNTRSKVGSPQMKAEFYIFDRQQDTVYQIVKTEIPGIDDLPDYAADYGQQEEEASKKAGRDIIVHGPIWSEDGSKNFIEVRSSDNKDRWIMSLDLSNGIPRPLDRQRDEAWIAGPGISYAFGRSSYGWLPDNQSIWFHSEESGYSHLYQLNISSGEKTAITSGNFEVSNAQLSRDKKHIYFNANEEHPGVKHFYRVAVNGGNIEKLTEGEGNHEATLSPDGKKMALRYSTANQPWELFVQNNRAGASKTQLTESLTEEFKSYDWRTPEFVTFTAEDGAEVHARIYQPENPEPNGKAVVFVHGAGYLQNAHKWWSQYFREYMFHNLLVDKGYTVLDIDYRGSAGYGRDWRTGIYRHMGGKDLSDHVDGAKFLVDEYNVDAEKIGIYGGSYGGFITLMAMFTEPGTFAAGAGLRSVTDWAHYNHPYTANILNEPYADSLAYAKSSPIYHAEGLEGALLICHGMIDTNVHFQDVVRLSQRLIELGKDNWEMAVYPLEDHGFVEPSSWTDEYKRILKLFEDNLN